VLGSGSRGNALIVDIGGVRIGVDAGFGVRTTAKRMRAAGLSPQSIDACVITHEHLDHAQGALAARDKWRWHLISTEPTFAAIGAPNATARMMPVGYEEPVRVGDARVTLLKVSHDAVAPSAVLIENMVTGIRVGVAQDLGEIPAGLADAFAHLDILVMEANHDVGMLRAGPYPVSVQDRVAGAFGHLSNAQSAEFIARVAHRGLRAVVLAHLSEQNNTPDIARTAVAQRLRGTEFRGKLITAKQDSGCAVGSARVDQLQLL
jgi:phosphoribosyl 1,2-cyclic phosphodiesterase